MRQPASGRSSDKDSFAPSGAGPGPNFGHARLALVGLLLAFVVAFAFRPILFGGRTLSAAAYVPGVTAAGPVQGTPGPLPRPMRDPEGAAWVDAPAPWLVHEALRRGHLPLWNARTGLGQPLLGNPNAAVLSPFALPVAFAPSVRAQDLAWLLRVFVVGLGALLLAREWGSSPAASLACGIAVALSGQTVQWIEHHPLNVDAFVPLALAAALALRRGRRYGGGMLALAVAAGCLGLKPQSAIVAGAAGLLWLLASNARGGRRVPLLAVSGWVLLGVGIASVALLPFLDMWQGASGLVDAGRSGQSEFSLPLALLPSLLGPWALGAPSSPLGLPWVGGSILLLAGIGLARGWRDPLAWVLGATALLLIARIFGLLPISLAGWPILGSIQWVKYCFPLYLALALLAARGIDALRPGWAGLVVLLVVAEFLWLMPRSWPERVDPWAPAPWVSALREGMAREPGRLSGSVQLAPPLVSAALGFSDLRSIDVLTPGATWEYVQRTIAPSEGIVWMLADPDPLLAATGPGGPPANLRWIVARTALDPDRLPAAVRAMSVAERLVRLFAELDSFSIDTRELGGGLAERGLDRRFHWVCETPCRLRFNLRSTPEGVMAGLAVPADANVRAHLQLEESSGAIGADSVQQMLSPTDEHWYDLAVESSGSSARPSTILLSVEADHPTTVFVGGVGPAPGVAVEAAREATDLDRRRRVLAALELHYAGPDAHLYQRTDALGPVFFAADVVTVARREEVWECVRGLAGRRAACVVGGHLPAAARDAAFVLEQREPSSWRVTTNGGGGLLVLSTLAARGFHARVDGMPVEIHEVDGALVGIVVPAGDHRVELLYAPRSLYRGAALSLVFLGIWLVLVVRRPRAAAPGGGALPFAAGPRGQ
ncbi:MAG: YfhO family protein [Deltaproteobacteria bacterium]